VLIVADLSLYLDDLATTAHGDGGWGYAPGQVPQLEPTCLALLALSLQPEGRTALIDAGRRAMSALGDVNGGFRPNHGRREAYWPTALALFTQAALGDPAADQRRTALRLLGQKGKAIDDPQVAEMQDIDLRLVGWPWADGNFSWAEPTAWACLALRKAGYGDHPRVAEGLRLLLNRAFDTGGINYGNRRIFNVMTEPLPGPTAAFLLAWQQREPQPRIDAALRWLPERALATGDLEDLCWTKIALAPFADRPEISTYGPRLDEAIAAAHRQRVQTSYLSRAPLRDALAALALGTDVGQPFRLTGRESAADPLPANVPAIKDTLGLRERVRAYFKRVAVDTAGRLRQAPLESSVHIERVADYNADLAGVLRRQFEHFRDKVTLQG
jgi:hypothetical protein